MAHYGGFGDHGMLTLSTGRSYPIREWWFLLSCFRVGRERYIWVFMPQEGHSSFAGCWRANAGGGQTGEKRQISLTGASQLPVKISAIKEGMRRINFEMRAAPDTIVIKRRRCGLGGLMIR